MVEHVKEEAVYNNLGASFTPIDESEFFSEN